MLCQFCRSKDGICKGRIDTHERDTCSEESRITGPLKPQPQFLLECLVSGWPALESLSVVLGSRERVSLLQPALALSDGLTVRRANQFLLRVFSLTGPLSGRPT